MSPEVPAVYERFTDRSRTVIQLANEEAQRFGHQYIGTEHLLLGLIREGDGLAARVLVKQGADLERTRREVYAMQEGENQQSHSRQRSRTPTLDEFGRTITIEPVYDIRTTRGIHLDESAQRHHVVVRRPHVEAVHRIGIPAILRDAVWQRRT